jgi:hypothetical protein
MAWAIHFKELNGYRRHDLSGRSPAPSDQNTGTMNHPAASSGEPQTLMVENNVQG